MDSNKITFYNGILLTLNILIMLSVLIWFKGTDLAWVLIGIQFSMCAIQAFLVFLLLKGWANETTETNHKKKY